MAGLFRRTAPSTDHSAGSSFERGPATTARPRNGPWVIGGVVLVVLSGFAAASLISPEETAVQRTSVVIAAQSIAEGRVLEAEDLAVAEITELASEIQVMAPEAIDQIIGRVAAGPIGSGSVVHPDQFIIGGLGQEPTVVIGAALGPNEYPLLTLRPGDLIRVVETRIDDIEGEDGIVRIDGRELAVAQIVEVRPLSSDQLHFSLRVGESSTNVLLDRIARGKVSIALIDGDTAARPAPALEPAAPLDPVDPATAPEIQGEDS